MLHRPQVLFLDESPVGLDPIARNSVWDDELCDEMAILHRGAVAAAGSNCMV